MNYFQNSFFKCGCPEKYLRFPCVSSIQPTGCGSDKIERQVLQPACFVNDHPNRYSVISSCDNTHLFEKNITQIQNEWKYCQKFSSLIKINIIIILYIIMSHIYHGSHFSARNRKLSTFFNDVCIDVVHFLLPVLSIKSMSIFWSLTYIFQKCYLCFMNTPYLSFIRQQLCKHGICSSLSKNIKIFSTIAQNKND